MDTNIRPRKKPRIQPLRRDAQTLDWWVRMPDGSRHITSTPRLAMKWVERRLPVP